MLEPYKTERQKQERNASLIGIILAVLAHAFLVVIGVTSGLKYVYPPPPEQEMMLIEFEDDIELVKPQVRRTGIRPQAEEVSKEIELVQQSQADLEGSKQNEGQEATLGDFGDVEVPEPERPKEINTKALFKTPDNQSKKDTLAPQTASEITDKLKAGHASGNTAVGKLDGKPVANVKGRTTVGTIPEPAYNVQEDGIVVVDIVVNQSGKVTSATPGGEGTTASSPELWKMAREAALKTQFNNKPDAPLTQAGTITYKFRLKN